MNSHIDPNGPTAKKRKFYGGGSGSVRLCLFGAVEAVAKLKIARF
jgi:hypothetical protein